MKRLHLHFFASIFLFALLPEILSATTFYVSSAGNDTNAGTSTSTSWKTLNKVSTTTFTPGDVILFNCGDTFTGQLIISSSGTFGAPIIYGKYGSGALPYLAAQGNFAQTIYAFNKQYFELTDLKVTNFKPSNDINSASGTLLRGIYLVNQNAGTMNHIYLTRLEVSDVNSQQVSDASRYYGGVFFEIQGTTTPSKWNDLLISSCNFHDVSRTALSWDSPWEIRSSTSSFGQALPNGYTDNWVPSTAVVVRGNQFQHISGNGLIIRVATNALAENNYFNYCGEQISGNAAFCFNTDGMIFQYNEACNTVYNTGDTDARGIDADFRTKNTIIQYNYLHDNGKGGIVGTGGPEDGTAYERFNIGMLVRYNILEDNEQQGMVFSGNLYNATIHNNVIFASSTVANVDIINFHAWVVYPHDVSFFSNVFFVKGTNPSYTYGDVRNITFNHNLYSFTSVPTGLPVAGYNSFGHIAVDNFSVINNPMFNLPGGTSSGYKLTAGSPAFNVGRRGLSQPTLDFYNNTIGNVRNIGVDQTPGISTTIYKVDINDVDNGSITSGWTGLVGTEGSATAINGVRFTMFGGIQGTRDRGTAGDVTRDFAYNDGAGAGVGVRLEYLPAGTYDVSTWHYDPNYPGLVNVEFREMGLPATSIIKVTGKSLTSSSPATFQIIVADGKDYEIIAREASTQDRSRFNGITITPVSGQRMAQTNTTIDESNSNALKVYPSPASDNFTIYKKVIAGTKLQINISDIQGRVIYSSIQQSIKGNLQLKMNKDELKMKTGIYTVTVIEEGKQSSCSVLIY